MPQAKLAFVGVLTVALLLAVAMTSLFSADAAAASSFHPQPTNTLPAQQASSDNGPYDWQLPAGFPVPKVPTDNPMSAAKVTLGRYLFYDTHLSGNNTYSCSSCHEQKLAFTDGRPLAIGSTGQTHPRNAMSLSNVAYNPTLTWANSTLRELERQILVPMFSEFPVEMGITGHEQAILDYFKQNEMYIQLFAGAFPAEAEPVNFLNIDKALSAFVRTLISGNSPYDRYVFQGDKTALSPSALRGMNLFLSEKLECNHCHTGFNFTLSTAYQGTTFVERPFFNTGLYNVDGKGAYPQGNTGLHEVTGNAADMGRFRPPTLRNIALTAPYMHDGSLPTLKDVLHFYSQGGRVIETGPNAGDGRTNPYKSTFINGFTLSDQEEADLLSFLNSLTDEQFITDKRLSNPFVTSP